MMQNSTRKVSVVIPHYKGIECLKRLLPSIVNQTFEDYEVIIIDDATPDSSVLEHITNLIKDYGNIRLIENGENLGFVNTCNKGIRLAKGQYICLLNQDTELRSNFIERNVEILDADGSIGVLSCTIVDQYGNNWSSGGSFRAGLPVTLQDDFQGIRTVDWIAGTAPFYRREVFDRIGLFDENYRMYHEDVEFGLRLRTETDYKACMFAERLVVHYHLLSIPRPEVYYLGHRNNILILRKYYPRYLPKVLLGYVFEVTRLLVASVLKPGPKPLLLVRPRPSLFLCALSSIEGILAGLIARQSK